LFLFNFLFLLINNLSFLFVVIIIIFNIGINSYIAIKIENLISSFVMVVNLEYLIKINSNWWNNMLCFSGFVLLQLLVEGFTILEFVH
jgi:hypothetical protein